MNKEELEYQLEKTQVENASLKLRIKTIKRKRKQESAKRRLLQQRIDKAIEYIEDLDKNKFETDDDVIVLDNYLNALLSILKGSEE